MKRIFIASSSENLDVAHATQINLEHDFDVTVWDQGVFLPSSYPLEALWKAMAESDYGIFVFVPNDVLEIRNQQYEAVRDNIIFEFGLFMGRFGKDKCFILVPEGTSKPRLPTDLAGLIQVRYQPAGNLQKALVSACYKIKTTIETIESKKGGSPSGQPETRPSKKEEGNLLTVVVGDRRESPPVTPGDFFAATTSTRDLTWLPSLRLPESTVIWNDKIISATSSDDQIPEYLKLRDLLIIGSPYCNLMARKINSSAFFHFNIDPFVLKEIDKIELEIRGLDRYSDRLKEIMEESNDFYNDWLTGLKGEGFVDPIKQLARVGASATDHDHDYAIISLCKHPYSREHYALLVAGMHLPGTMAAVKQLTVPEFFIDHPFGGILKVTIPDGGWYERLTRSTISWYTPSYTYDDMEKDIGRSSKLYHERKLGLEDLLEYQDTLSCYQNQSLRDVIARFIGRA